MKITLSPTMINPLTLKRNDVKDIHGNNQYDFLMYEKPTALVPSEDIGIWEINGNRYCTLWLKRNPLSALINDGDDFYYSVEFETEKDMQRWVKNLHKFEATKERMKSLGGHITL